MNETAKIQLNLYSYRPQKKQKQALIRSKTLAPQDLNAVQKDELDEKSEKLQEVCLSTKYQTQKNLESELPELGDDIESRASVLMSRTVLATFGKCMNEKLVKEYLSTSLMYCNEEFADEINQRDEDILEDKNPGNNKGQDASKLALHKSRSQVVQDLMKAPIEARIDKTANELAMEGIILLENGLHFEGFVKKTKDGDQIAAKPGKILNADGTLLYEGDFKNNLQHGKGQEKLKNGNSYKGDFKDGKKHGKGKLTFKDKAWYDGQFENDKFQGKGKYRWYNTNVYEGQYSDNMQNGKGTMTFKKGMTYEGQFKDSKFDGYGTYKYRDGTKYEGEWKQNKQHGIGVIVYPDGVRRKGRYENGIKVEALEI